MKKNIIFAAIAIITVSSCQKETLDSTPANSDAVRFTGIVPETKTYLSGLKTYWWEDHIYILKESSKYEYETAAQATSSASFNPSTGVTPPADIVSTDTYALYPYDQYDSNISLDSENRKINVTVTQTQWLKASDFSSQKPILVAKSTASGELAFNHATALLKFTIDASITNAYYIYLYGYNNYDGADMISGVLTATLNTDGTLSTSSSPTRSGSDAYIEMKYTTSSEPMAIPAGTYYATIVPGTYWQGIGIKIQDSSWSTITEKYTSDKGDPNYKKAVFEAGQIYNLGTFSVTP